ncbi:hypothetical protein LEMLEM_LOCUS5436 [Lemmus lemmus]
MVTQTVQCDQIFKVLSISRHCILEKEKEGGVHPTPR